MNRTLEFQQILQEQKSAEMRPTKEESELLLSTNKPEPFFIHFLDECSLMVSS